MLPVAISHKMQIVPNIDLQDIDRMRWYPPDEVFLHLSLVLSLFHLFFSPSLSNRSELFLASSLSWWEKLTLLREGEFELDSSQSPLPPPEAMHQTPSTPLPSATATIRTSDLLSAVCMTKTAFLVRVFEKGRTKQKGRSSPCFQKEKYFKQGSLYLRSSVSSIINCALFITGLAITEQQPVMSIASCSANWIWHVTWLHLGCWI